jgi:hypothetical protein
MGDLSKYDDPSDYIVYGEDDEDMSLESKIVSNGFLEFFWEIDVNDIFFALTPKEAKKTADKIYALLKELEDS